MTGSSDNEAIVIGAGVSGLTTAVVLAEAGIRTTVVSDRPPSDTTSAVAGASWGPYLAGHDDVLRWSALSRDTFTGLARDPDSGVRMVPGVEAYDDLDEAPQWARDVPGFRMCLPHEVPPGYTGGWRYTIPMVDMPRYLTHLERRLGDLGGTLRYGHAVTSWRDLEGVVVNCTGLGAEELADDDHMVPIRGQLVLVENPGITEFFQDNVAGNDLTCIFPHQDYVVLGGTSAPGERSLEWDEDEAAAITARCVAIEPRLAGARVVGRRVGLRPGRSAIRVERDPDDPRVIHNYGHGGSGVTLSWGCAQDVLRLLTGPVVAGPPRNVDR
ncbi:D-amino-acid:oxygen oxidoreductase (deaminating) [Stackebrandtia albiflava]|uniref:D-amino-acid oxidase n=1 Tax=Stackebrandtia albiflava TaxID=406432 RepID=A0A562URX4_9ACTN|nr:FAD-dependent oxidoreductase [Stackebrandtia albiflava]TWJ08348.1 D-amino-acid:oxygen oxidoreductase (deaminating) [Stackebrandtia albiflava]